MSDDEQGLQKKNELPSAADDAASVILESKRKEAFVRKNPPSKKKSSGSGLPILLIFKNFGWLTSVLLHWTAFFGFFAYLLFFLSEFTWIRYDIGAPIEPMMLIRACRNVLIYLLVVYCPCWFLKVFFTDNRSPMPWRIRKRENVSTDLGEGES